MYLKQLKWTCYECSKSSIQNVENKEEDEVVTAELVQQIKNQDLIIKTLSNDLNQSCEEIQRLKNHNTQLETLVLTKEETIILLEREIKKFKNTLAINSDKTGNDKTKPRLSLEVGLPETFSSILKKKSNRARPTTKPMEKKGFETPNRYETLSLEDEPSSTSESEDILTEAQTKKNKKQKKIWICADSHGRDLSWEINQQVSSYEAVGFVRPGARTKQVAEIYNNLNEVESEDVVVLITGTNDVSKNESLEAVQEISSLLEFNGRPTCNIILVDLPKRHDLVNWSCVNTEVNNTNFALKELCDKHKNVTLVKASTAERTLHTRHGSHLNLKGKKWLANKIVESVRLKLLIRKTPDIL
ncbi:hypothetical protein J6590_058652 [Homalodisca vitripennis]|nr:hypothetical protein J6590_058652 [Homalodisca vitripennis]